VDNEERIREITRLRNRLADFDGQKAALDERETEHATSLSQIRERLGNPFFYSGVRHGRPENATKTVAKYTGYKSHEPGLALLLERVALQRDIAATLDQLRALNADSDE
jgi:hypothetical protein